MEPQQLILAGIAVIFIGFLLILIGAFNQKNADIRFAVGGVVGFVPFGFANDRKLLAAGIGIAALIIFLLLFRILK